MVGRASVSARDEGGGCEAVPCHFDFGRNGRFCYLVLSVAFAFRQGVTNVSVTDECRERPRPKFLMASCDFAVFTVF